MPRPDFFILGAPKCGTTAMYQWLSAHPDLYLPAKELHYWGADLHHRRPKLSRDQYLALFADARPDQLVGEVAVWYLMSTQAPVELKAFAPDARVIAMLRHPAELIHSLHSQLLYSGEEDLTDLKAALAAEPDRRAGRRIPKSTHVGLEAPPDECLHYHQVVNFAPQIARWQACFGKQLLVVLHDELRADPQATYRHVLDFIGADTSFSPDFSVVNPNKRVRSQASQRLIQGLRWGPWNRLVPPGHLRNAARRGFQRLQHLNTSFEQRAPLDGELRSQLLAELAPGVDALEHSIKRDLDSWRR
ncbi:MAG: sulfotransferase [Oligoflexia bacterium]|nr:sulfotransferase [Oligoflexia bacterium]